MLGSLIGGIIKVATLPITLPERIVDTLSGGDGDGLVSEAVDDFADEVKEEVDDLLDI